MNPETSVDQTRAAAPLRVRGVEHIGIAVKDMGAARTVLETLGLSVELEQEWPQFGVGMAWYPAGGTGLELLCGGADAPFVGKWLGDGAGFFHVCLEVDDIRAAMAALKERGVELSEDEPHPGHGGRLMCFIDPESTAGLLFELVQVPDGETD
ncbi:MAG TPA: VOC family protein [Solirubrobacteraceae bacterium]|nr:VOC family protein [Solirubrobacteraceae bacterium]